MQIKLILTNKKKFIDLLLLADEQEDMIDRYLEHGDLFALYDDELIGTCVVTREEEGVYELKSIAVYEKYQGRGYGQKLVEHIFDHYQDRCKTMYVGTGDSPIILSFYKKCGFQLSHKVKNFFVDNYNHPIFEYGKQLIDMIYLKKEF